MNYEVIICDRNGYKTTFIIEDYDYDENDPTIIMLHRNDNCDIVINTNNVTYYMIKDISDLDANEFKDEVLNGGRK